MGIGKVKRTPLKRYTPLKAKKPINKVSPKQAKRNRELGKIEPPQDGLCQSCGRPADFRGLAKHHIKFRSAGGHDNPDNLIWLCGKCHARAHGLAEI